MHLQSHPPKTNKAGQTGRLLLIGYACVSKYDDQNTAAQLRALKENGCDRIFKKSPPVGIGIGMKSAADLAQMFKVHPATVSRLIAQ